MVEGELKKRLHLMFASVLTRTQYIEFIKSLTIELKSIVDEAKKDIFKELKIKKLRFKHSKDGWDWTEEDVPKLLDKLEKWFGDSS